MRTNLYKLLLIAILATVSSCTAAAPTTAPAPTTAKISGTIQADDSRFVYEGRFDMTSANSPVVIWQGSRISLDFEGDKVSLLFDQPKGECYFDVHVDGTSRIVLAKAGEPSGDAVYSGLGNGRHHLMLFKRTEATAGTARFRGVELAGNALPPTRHAYKLRMEFIGDSITAGACTEDGGADQWSDHRTHNNALSYGAMTAAAFDADYRNIAVSGMGVSIGWSSMKAGDVWDKLYPDPASAKADLTKWTPQVAFVNLGENDDSFPKAKKLPFPPDFAERYVAMVKAIRAAHPDTHIVLLRGGMWGGHNSDPLRMAWESAVTQLESSDKAISHFVFTHWSQTHPRVADHKAMSDELVAWLKQQKFMGP